MRILVLAPVLAARIASKLQGKPVLGYAVLLAMLIVGRAAYSEPVNVLPNSAPLTIQTDFAADMVAGIDRFFDRELAASIERRQKLWHMDFSSAEAYATSVAPNREHFARIIGAVDQRVLPARDEFCAMPVAATSDYTVQSVRWPVFPGVDTEGLLLEPTAEAIAAVIALPDADQTPEMLAGLAPGLVPECQYARRLAENGCRVYVPVLIDRGCEWSGNPRQRMTNQTHREWIYRMSFEVGRHIIGYEVQKVLGAVDRLSSHDQQATRLPIGVMGWGEGGLIAFYAAALDTRIDAALVSGYFQSRQQVWVEPVYRNIWALLHEFGDAEIAGLIAPRTLIIEAGPGPEIAGPPKLEGHEEAAPGRLTTPPNECVRAEYKRSREPFEKLGVSDRIQLVEPIVRDQPCADEPLGAFLKALGHKAALKPPASPPQDSRGPGYAKTRLHRQFDQLVEYTQKLLRDSHLVRAAFWSKADSSSPEAWAKSCEWYREYFHEEVIGRLPPASLPANPRTRKIHDEPKFTGYEVVLDVWPNVFAYGVLLVPKDLREGERRPVVVCQHGLEGRPDKVVDPKIKSLYQSFGAKLADEGFVVFAPQNPYIGENNFRILQRKANPLKASLFSVITRQHERILEWLGEQPFVDRDRIGFYGISYGGKTAMRVPVLLPQYALSICSADFNEYVLKVASPDYPFGFMFVQEYEIPEFNFANTFNHAELAGLIAPRPFMVERGHNDPVASDEWVSFEYAKVRRLYSKLDIAGLTEIEFFPGKHEIHGVGTFDFLHRQLKWPAR